MNSGLWFNLLRKTVIITTFYFPAKEESVFKRKNHTREKGGAHHRISFLGFIDELEKQLFKKLLKSASKKQNNFNICNVVFFKKNKEKRLQISLFYTCVPKILMI